MSLIPLSLALGYVRQDAGVDDDVVEVLLEGAESSALSYLNRDVYATDEDMAAAVANGTAGAYAMVVNGAIKVAILKTVAELYANRENSADYKLIELPFNVRSLLQPLRIIPGV
jgi:hypothetical protein